MALADLIVRIRQDFSGKGFDEAQARARELNARIAEVSAGLAVAGLAAAKAGLTISSALAGVSTSAAAISQSIGQIAAVGSAAVITSFQALQGAIATVTASAAAMNTAVGGAANATGVLVDAYRVARVVLSPTPFTLITIAATVAAEKLTEVFAGLILEQNRLIETSARTAATLGQSFNQVFQVATASRITGADLSVFKSLDGLAESLDALRQIEDPVRRASQAVALFGGDARQAQAALSLLNTDVRQAVERSRELDAALDPEARVAISRASSAFDTLKRNLSEIRVGQRAFVEDLKQTIAILGANIFNGAVSGLQRVGQALQTLQGLLAKIGAVGSVEQTRQLSVPSLTQIQKEAEASGLGQVKLTLDPIAKQLIEIQGKAAEARAALRELGVTPVERLRAELTIAQQNLARVAAAADGSADSFANLKNAENAVEEANNRLNNALQTTIRDFGQVEDVLKKAFGALNVTSIGALRQNLAESEQALRLITQAAGDSEDGLIDVKNATDAVTAAQKRLSDALGATRTSIDSLAQAQIGSRVEAGFREAVRAVTDFILASEPIGTKLPLHASKLSDAIFEVVSSFDEFSNESVFSIRAVTDEVELLRAKLEQTGKVARIDVEVNVPKLPLPGVLETGAILNRGGQQSQVQLREAANQAGNDLQRLVELQQSGQATQADVVKQQRIYSDAVARAAGLTVTSVGTQIRAFQTLRGEISRSVQSISASISEVIVFGGSLGDVFLRTAQTISNSIIQFAINQGLKLLGQELSKLGGLLGSVGRQLSSIFGTLGSGAAQTAAQTTQQAAGAASSAAGGVAAGALGGVAGTITAVSSAVSAVTGVLSFLQGRRMEQDIGRIEVTSREIFAQVTNIWNDNKANHASLFTRLGDIWSTLRHIDEGLAQVDIGKRTNGATLNVAGDVVIQDPVGDPDTLMQNMVRRLKQKDRAFAIA